MSLLGIYVGHQIGTLIGLLLAEKGGVKNIINDLKYKSLMNDKNVDTSFNWENFTKKEDNHGKPV